MPNKKAVDRVLSSSNMNSYDTLAVMNRYEKQNKTTLSSDIARRFTGKTQEKYLNNLANSCMEVSRSSDRSLSAKAFNRIDRETPIKNMLTRKEDGYNVNVRVSNMALGIRG